MKYRVNPLVTRDFETDQMVDSPVVVFELMNALGEVIEIDI